jgi:hypothetical protein
MPRKPKPTARDKIAQAIANLDDGAHFAAVGLLREAATMIEEAARAFNDRLEKSIGKKGAPKP